MNAAGTDNELSLNASAAPLVEDLVGNAERLRVQVTRGPLGERRIDCGSATAGGLEAGRRLAEICLAGLGTVTFQPADANSDWPFAVSVHTAQPVLACLGAQYAGWALSSGDAYSVLGSGPGRAAGSSEPLFDELGYRDRAETACLVLETDAPPPQDLVAEIAGACGVPADRLTFLFAPTTSLAGTVQITARVLEVALHKAHELNFPLERIVDGLGTAPLPPPAPDFVEAMGRTNDAIIFAGRVKLFVSGPADEARQLAEALPSRRSKDYGVPFRDTFERVQGDFYAIDPMLFSPAQVSVVALETGETFRDGQVDEAALTKSLSG